MPYLLLVAEALQSAPTAGKILLGSGLPWYLGYRAHGVAGSMKNALDWLVSSLELPEKSVALINTSQRAIHAPAQLREILTTMSARLIESASITLPLWGRNLDATAIASDPALSEQLRTALQCFVTAIRMSAGSRQ